MGALAVGYIRVYTYSIYIAYTLLETLGIHTIGRSMYVQYFGKSDLGIYISESSKTHGSI